MNLSAYNTYIDSIIAGVADTSTASNMGTVKSINSTNICGEYGNKDGSKELKNWNDADANINTITQYWCIYQTSFEKIGSTGAKLPEIHTGKYNCKEHDNGSKYDPEKEKHVCKSFSSCVKYKSLVQETCNGHKLKSADDRNQTGKIPNIKPGSVITYDFYNALVEIINFQIAERIKSPKYKYYKTTNVNNIPIKESLTKINKSTIKASEAKLSGHIDYSEYMSRVIDKLSSLQTNSEYDNFPAGEKFIKLKSIEYTLQGSSQISSFEKNEIGQNMYKPSLVLNLANMTTIIDVIKDDLNDCICYSDCNGYSVCFCYGNCNHY